MATVKVFNHKGEFLTDIEVEISGDDFRKEFLLPHASPLCTADNLSFGNYVKIVEWEGVILPPRTWNQETVTGVAYEKAAVEAHYKKPKIDL